MGDRLILFAKAAVPGRVKTRLVPPLTPEQAAAVYDASVRDVYDRCRSAFDDIAIYYDGDEAYFIDAFPGAPRVPQGSGDLGQRMAAAFEREFADGTSTVTIVGGDSPTLPLALLHDARTALDEAQVALGPSEDGGYYLIGIRREAWPGAGAILTGIPWSTPRVLEETLQRAVESRIVVGKIGTWYDIDRPEDLRRAASDATTGSRIARVLREVLPADG